MADRNFLALKYLRDDYSLTNKDDIEKLKELSAWFNKNLQKPSKFSTGNSQLKARVSLSWFKDSAQEHISKMQEFILIAERYDIIVERVTAKNPGYIVFEDEFQVSAVPFKTERKKIIQLETAHL